MFFEFFNILLVLRIKIYVIWKHSTDPPRVPPIRHPKRVALPENAHFSWCIYGKANPFVSSYMPLGLGLTFSAPKKPFSQKTAQNKEKRTYFVI
jgi:hypothetical protein